MMLDTVYTYVNYTQEKINSFLNVLTPWKINIRCLPQVSAYHATRIVLDFHL